MINKNSRQWLPLFRAEERSDQDKTHEPLMEMLMAYLLKDIVGTSLAVQWLRLHISTAGDMGLIPGEGTRIPQATWHGQKKKKKTQWTHIHCIVVLDTSLQTYTFVHILQILKCTHLTNILLCAPNS